jgi:hypothetical protein
MRRDFLIYAMIAIACGYPFLDYWVNSRVSKARYNSFERLTDFCNVEGSHCKVLDRRHPPSPYGAVHLNI